MSIWVKWSAQLPNSGTYVTRDQETLLGEWADCAGNGESAVEDCIEHWATVETFDELYGVSSGYDGELLVTVHSPPSIAGAYEVGLEIVVKVTSARRKAVIETSPSR